METERSHMIERILDLTLEIIYMLTGENYIAFKLSDGTVTPNFKRTRQPCVEAPPPSLGPDRNNDKSFPDVTKKLIELLTGEVPIRCQDVAVYLSMEEQEYLDRHCELYKAAMMEDQPSSDESKKRNLPIGCSSPLCPQESAQGEHNTAQSYQAEERIDIKIENLDERSADMRLDDQREEKEASPAPITEKSSQKHLPERCSPALYSQDSTIIQPFQSGKPPTNDEDVVAEVYVKGYESCVKEISSEISPGGACMETPSKRCSPPLPSQNSTLEEPSIPHYYQGVIITDDEEKNAKGGEWIAKKENPPEISPDGSVMRDNPESSLHYSQCSPEEEEQDILQHYLDVVKIEDSDEEDVLEREDEQRGERPILPEISTDEQYVISHSGMCLDEEDIADFPSDRPLSYVPVFNTTERSVEPSTHGGHFPRLAQPVLNPPATWIDLSGQCYEPEDANRTLQEAKKSFSCLSCGKSFKHRSNLETHERTHNGHRPYACSVCDKRFTQKAHLDTHTRIHTGEKPFVCLTCGRSFRDRSNLITHQRTHTGLRPYSCLRCGKKFRRKMHQKEHVCDHPAHYFK